MGMLDTLMQMLSSNKSSQQQPQPQMRVNKGATTRALSMRDEYMQYQMQMQEQGEVPLPYEQWIAMKAKQLQPEEPKK